jgi:hypothetical protein
VTDRLGARAGSRSGMSSLSFVVPSGGGYVIPGAMRNAVTDTGKHTLAADSPERSESTSVEVWMRAQERREARDGEA